MRQQISPTAITTKEQMTYYLMTKDEALNEMIKLTEKVNDILGLPSTTLVRLILIHFHWDQNTLTDRFYEDPDKLFKTINVANPYLSPSIQWDPLSPGIQRMVDPMLSMIQQTSTNGNHICRTCYLDAPASEFYSLPCRHQHCLRCWQSYLESTVAHCGCVQSISCLSRCNQIIDDEQILKLLSNNQNLRERYQKFLIDIFVETNRLTQWCPGKGCSTIVKIKTYTPNCAQLIECDVCKTMFCFQCLNQWHEPLQCSVLKKWEEKNRDESMTGRWILAHTRECPSCRSSIEKNGGCNHMTCRKPGCGYEFCWLCFGDWKEHATRQCNVYKQEETERSQSEAREILARYMHYFTRYQTHNQSLELEANLLEKVAERQQEMQAESRTHTEQAAVPKAFEVLQKCRRTLKYTYPFAYYLKRNNQSEIFEQNQADLERATEVLSGFLENGNDTEQYTMLQLMDKTSYCEKRRNILIDHCKDGYSKNYWEGLDQD